MSVNVGRGREIALSRRGRPVISAIGKSAVAGRIAVRGLNLGAVIGERWRIGSTELEVCQPRQPCYKLGIAFGDPMMVRRFAHAGRPGAYLRIITEGELGAGDEVEILWRPGHGITIATVALAIVSDDGAAAVAAGAHDHGAPLHRQALGDFRGPSPSA